MFLSYGLPVPGNDELQKAQSVFREIRSTYDQGMGDWTHNLARIS